MIKYFFILSIAAQFIVGQTYSKCGIIPETENSVLRNTYNWGYGYNDLLNDLNIWNESPFVTIDSIGASVQNRALWEMTISGEPESTTLPRIYIHTRTHPGEEESFWVVDEIINILLSDAPYADFIRNNTIFHIIPMYNPDGVELGYARENAHGVDIESGWDDNPLEPEVAVLKNRFIELMDTPNPIKVALNMHSAYACYRYFVYHDSYGTSPLYAQLEQNYITGVRDYFLNGIEPWTHYVSWTNGTPDQYPESWWWMTHGENVMALTYEDMNACDDTGLYDSTANAIVRGTMDYLGLEYSGTDSDYIISPARFVLEQNYPNPFNSSTTIRFSILMNNQLTTSIHIYSATGQLIETVLNQPLPSGDYELSWDGSSHVSGVYFIQLKIGDKTQSRKMVYLK
ncbi:MAG: T9SS type A sorting domain-containing protein [Candidatus Marinimicrobia bacterium]|nr:T9SS type A sorting domain-containing protein [Candidatus Neomarinimicrobiota bacterium]